jgi:hypothetical protein
MTLRTLVLAGLVLAGTAAAPAAGASSPAHDVHASAHRSEACRPAGARTLSVGSQLRAFSMAGEVVACVRASGRQTILGSAPGGDGGCFPDFCSVGRVAVAGALVAYGVDNDGRGGLDYHVIVRDVLRRRVISDRPNGVFHPEDFDRCLGATGGSMTTGIGPTTDLVVRRDGAVAWIAQRKCDARGPASYEVFTQSRAQTPVLRDASLSIAPTSLHLTGAGVGWSNAGQPHRATF